MKTSQQHLTKLLLGLALLAVILIEHSCSPDPVLEDEESVEAIDARFKYKQKYVLKKLVRGAKISGANGVDIGPDGNLYIASVNDQEIVVMNKRTGRIIKKIGQEKGVVGPDDLVFGPDGSLYWTDILIGEVGRMTPEGVVTKQFVAPGVNPITFSPDGRLFVALDFLGDGLYELDPHLVDPPRPIVVCSDPQNPFCLGFLNSFNVGPDGRLYGPLFAANLVISVNVDPDNSVTSDPYNDLKLDLQIIAGLGGEFKNPAAAKFGPDGMLYVLDQAGKVVKIDTHNNTQTSFATLQPGLDNMAFDEDGTLYISNNDEGWVGKFLRNGHFRILSRGGMIRPQGLAVYRGTLFEADLFQLRQFGRIRGRQLNSYKGFLVPEGPESLILPMNISADGHNLIISSWFSGAVQVWNPQNGVVETVALGPPGVPTVPIDAIRFKDDIVVSDLALGGVVMASSKAVILPIDNTNVFAPGGLATDGKSVWVADWATGLIWQIDFNGTSPKEPVVVASDLVNPEGLALDRHGRLLVVESGASRLSRINLAKGKTTVIVEGLELSGPGLEGFPPTWFFDGVAVGRFGDIYISGGGENVIYRVRRNRFYHGYGDVNDDDD